jgi:hypothetical protein
MDKFDDYGSYTSVDDEITTTSHKEVRFSSTLIAPPASEDVYDYIDPYIEYDNVHHDDGDRDEQDDDDNHKVDDYDNQDEFGVYAYEYITPAVTATSYHNSHVAPNGHLAVGNIPSPTSVTPAPTTSCYHEEIIEDDYGFDRDDYVYDFNDAFAGNDYDQEDITHTFTVTSHIDTYDDNDCNDISHVAPNGQLTVGNNLSHT